MILYFEISGKHITNRRDPLLKADLGRYLPRKLGNLTNKVEVGRGAIGRGVHVNESHVMPQRDRFRSALLGGLDAVLGSVFVTVRVELQVGGGAVGEGLTKGLAKRHLRFDPEYHIRIVGSFTSKETGWICGWYDGI
jgi:hypothetical protein